MRRKIWIAVSVFTFLCVAAGLLLPALQPASESRPRPRCTSNLKQILYACHLYSGDHNEDFPPTLGALVPDYITDGELFLCPTSGKAKELLMMDLPEGAKDVSTVWGERFSDYVYVEGLSPSDDPMSVLSYDKDGNHEGGRVVAFIGGDVRWMKEPEFRAALAEPQARIRERPRAGRTE
jgi:hypothetical protein